MAISEPRVRTKGQLQSLHNFQQKFGSNCKNSLPHWKAWSWLPMAFKKIQTHPPKPAEAEPSFRKVSLPPAKLPTQIYSLWQALDLHLLSKFQLVWKWVGPRMLKGQLSRVPWPGNSWMPFTFQPALWVLLQPHKHSYSLQQVIHTQVAHH